MYIQAADTVFKTPQMPVYQSKVKIPKLPVSPIPSSISLKKLNHISGGFKNEQKRYSLWHVGVLCPLKTLYHVIS
jgi:hypothetical protein